MIARSRLNWFRTLFVWHGSVLRTILPQLFAILAISLCVSWTRGQILGHNFNPGVPPFTLIGVSLAIFLGFRNNASYDRYWEGRKIWGALLNVTRSLTRQASTLGRLGNDDVRFQEWLSLLIAFAHALRHQLRQSDPASDLERLLPSHVSSSVLAARYRPAMLLKLMGNWVSMRMQEGLFGEISAVAMDANLNHVSDVLGACERLANTPLPYPYSVMIHRTVYIYCLLLPFGLIGTVGVLTPVISVLVAYSFIALEALAQELENPFGTSPNDLPLERLCHGIEESLREMAGQQITTEETVPENYVLL